MQVNVILMFINAYFFFLEKIHKTFIKRKRKRKSGSAISNNIIYMEVHVYDFDSMTMLRVSFFFLGYNVF